MSPTERITRRFMLALGLWQISLGRHGFEIQRQEVFWVGFGVEEWYV